MPTSGVVVDALRAFIASHRTFFERFDAMLRWNAFDCLAETRYAHS
jgi:hypothetical protein